MNNFQCIRCPTIQKRRFVSGGCDNLVKIWTFDEGESRWVEVSFVSLIKAVGTDIMPLSFCQSKWLRMPAWCGFKGAVKLLLVIFVTLLNWCIIKISSLTKKFLLYNYPKSPPNFRRILTKLNYLVQSHVLYALRLQRAVRTTISHIFKFRTFYGSLESNNCYI